MLSNHENTRLVLTLLLTEHCLTVSTAGDDLPAWLVYTSFLYFTGVVGMIFNYKNFLVTMMSIELMYLGAISSFVMYASVGTDPRGSIYALVALILAACESAIGLGLLIVLFRFGRTIEFSDYNQLGG